MVIGTDNIICGEATRSMLIKMAFIKDAEIIVHDVAKLIFILENYACYLAICY